MSVETYNPKLESPVSFTDAAIAHLCKQVQSHKALGIEFNVKESGCSGFKYLLELAYNASATAQTYTLNDDLTLYIEPRTIKLIRGTQVDYVREGVNQQLRFANPNATALCGCGESFSVE